MTATSLIPPRAPMFDGLGRRISYVRLSVTDRCDLRCRYCMAESMTFRPSSELLSFDEIVTLADLLIARGVRRIRLTGGEPLVRRGVEQLAQRLGQRIGRGLDELTMTTNGTQLARFAARLHAAGIRRVNVSLDTLDPVRFRNVTRRGNLDEVLAGIAEARAAGLRVKINMVALKGVNDDEFETMLRWCGALDHDLTLIEAMPLGEVDSDRAAQHLPLDAVMTRLSTKFDLIPSLATTGGPARYFEVAGLGVRLGMIAPFTNNFCAGCNRIRISATGTVYGCLGHDQKVELRDLLRCQGGGAVDAALDRLLAGKPDGHLFSLASKQPAVARHMSVTGG